MTVLAYLHRAGIDRPEHVIRNIYCGQESVIALSSIYYPTSTRSTGVGWALGIGRLGGIGGPLLIGVLLAWQLSAQHILYAAAIPMLMAGLLVALLGRWYATTASRA